MSFGRFSTSHTFNSISIFRQPRVLSATAIIFPAFFLPRRVRPLLAGNNSFSLRSVFGKFPFLSLSDSLVLRFALCCSGWICDCGSSVFGTDGEFCRKTNWLEKYAWTIFSRFLTPANKWCHDWSCFQTIYPIPSFDTDDEFCHKTNWLEKGAWTIFSRFLTPANKWCHYWWWFKTICSTPLFDRIPVPVN